MSEQVELENIPTVDGAKMRNQVAENVTHALTAAFVPGMTVQEAKRRYLAENGITAASPGESKDDHEDD